MPVENPWLTQAEAVDALGVSRQQLHKLRKAGRIRFRRTPTRFGIVPEYLRADVEARKESRATAGRPRKVKKWQRPWETLTVYELMNLLLDEPQRAQFVLVCAIKVRVELDSTCKRLYGVLKDRMHQAGRAERFRVLCLVTAGQEVDLAALMEPHRKSAFEMQEWREFAQLMDWSTTEGFETTDPMKLLE